MRQPRLYISYSRADKAFVTRLATYLYRAYDEVWFDEHRYGGDVWWDDLLWNLKACDIFIYLLSPQSVEATYCRAEYAEALRLRKQILPVVIRDETPVPADMEVLPVVNMVGPFDASSVGELLAALKQLEYRFSKAPLPPLDPMPTPVPPVIDDLPNRRSPGRLAALLVIGGVLLIVLGFASRQTVAPTATLTPIPMPSETRLLPTATGVPPTDEPASPTPTATTAPSSTSAPSDTPTPTGTASPTWTVSPSATEPPQTSTSTVPPTVTRRATNANTTP
jgi:TIR domain